MVDQVTLQEQEHASAILTLDSLPYYVEENPFKSTGQCSPHPSLYAFVQQSSSDVSRTYSIIALKKENCAWGLRAV